MGIRGVKGEPVNTEDADSVYRILATKGVISKGEIRKYLGWTIGKATSALITASFIYPIFEVGEAHNTKYGLIEHDDRTGGELIKEGIE